MLAVACGRNKSALTKRRRQYYCLLFKNLNLEFDLRGLPRPPQNSHVGNLVHDPDAPYVA